MDRSLCFHSTQSLHRGLWFLFHSCLKICRICQLKTKSKFKYVFFKYFAYFLSKQCVIIRYWMHIKTWIFTWMYGLHRIHIHVWYKMWSPGKQKASGIMHHLMNFCKKNLVTVHFWVAGGPWGKPCTSHFPTRSPQWFLSATTAIDTERHEHPWSKLKWSLKQ